MNVEIRPCRDREELQSYGQVVSYVFSINQDEDMERELQAVEPEWTMCAFVDGRVVSTYGAFPFTVRLNGSPVEMGGVTAVGTLPHHRRKGLLRKTMTAGLHAMHERGQPFGILWASMGAIYQRFGYGLATPHIAYKFDPRNVELLPGQRTPGRCELIESENALEQIRPVQEAYAASRNMVIERPPYLWKMGALRSREKRKVYTAVYRNAAGEVTGYVVYNTREAPRDELGPNQVLEVQDLAWLDLDAYRGLWEFIRSHDLVYEVQIRGLVGEDDPMQELLFEPRMVDKRTVDGVWMRIVDVERGLAARPYREPGALCLEVVDDLLPWNNGRWAFETDGTATTVSRTVREPELTMPVATLATLISGHRGATVLERAGKLEAASMAALRRADRMFATEYAPLTPDDF